MFLTHTVLCTVRSVWTQCEDLTKRVSGVYKEWVTLGGPHPCMCYTVVLFSDFAPVHYSRIELITIVHLLF